MIINPWKNYWAPYYVYCKKCGKKKNGKFFSMNILKDHPYDKVCSLCVKKLRKGTPKDMLNTADKIQLFSDRLDEIGWFDHLWTEKEREAIEEIVNQMDKAELIECHNTFADRIDEETKLKLDPYNKGDYRQKVIYPFLKNNSPPLENVVKIIMTQPTQRSLEEMRALKGRI